MRASQVREQLEFRLVADQRARSFDLDASGLQLNGSRSTGTFRTPQIVQR
jgi:hypothetical protein